MQRRRSENQIVTDDRVDVASFDGALKCVVSVFKDEGEADSVLNVVVNICLSDGHFELGFRNLKLYLEIDVLSRRVEFDLICALN